MIASLPMYATPRTAGANARLWALIRDGLRRRNRPAPERLIDEIPDPKAHWLSPDLVLSQTCGLPYRLWLADRVGLVGTPDYGLDGCPPGHYRSVVIARSDDRRAVFADFHGARFALNDPHSQSGWAALATFDPAAVQAPAVLTGSHRGSVRAVREGRADFAAIDAVTWRLLAAEDQTAGLSVLLETPPTPGLPLITARSNDASAIHDAVAEAIDGLAPADRSSLGLTGIVRLPAESYLALPTPPPPEILPTA
jgi:hypothetical protein